MTARSFEADSLGAREAHPAPGPASQLAAFDQGFLLGDSMRGVRFLLEFSKADEILRRRRIRSTLVVFGSARIGEHGPPRHVR